MTTCDHHQVCAHLSPRLRRLSHSHGGVVELMVASLLQGLQDYDPGAQDFAVVTSLANGWSDAVDIDDPEAGVLSFLRVRIASGIDVEAFVHEFDANYDEVQEGDRIQWVVERDSFEAFAHRVAEDAGLV